MRCYILLWMLLVTGPAFSQGQARQVFMCKATNLRIKAESTGALTYNWYRNNEIVAGAFSKELVVQEEGDYKAVGVNEDGCLSGESVLILVRYHTPVAVDDIASGNANTSLLLDVIRNDQSACSPLDPASLVVTAQPKNGKVTVVDGKLSITPGDGFSGQLNFTYTVNDKTGQTSNIANVRVDIGATSLPVTLAYFDVRKEEYHAILDWKTAGETNSDHFDVERSIDMKDWVKIGEVMSAQESEVAQNYSHTDSLPESGLNYYRLRMVDKDNTFAYSKVRSVHFPEFSWAEVYPNPVDDLLNIVIRNKKVKNLRMISNAGIVRFSKVITTPSFTVSMKQYPVGMYYLHFEQEDGNVKIYKLMHD